MERSFFGPIFLVGMPRSGTKLLRSLLNNHSLMVFPSSETHILPYWVNHWEEYGDLSDFKQFQLFYNEAKKHSFFSYMQECISAEEWYQACSGWGVAEVFEALVKLDINYSEQMIWGEKSPSYIKHIPLLKKIYPDAKIIHIIRDVRDHCLSMNKAWGKNMIRAAQRWSDDTSKASLDIKELGVDGYEIRFEDLLADSTKTLSSLCDFLCIPYEDSMIKLKRPTENLGDAKGETRIVTHNKGKWHTKMNPGLIKKIEKISITQLNKYKYPADYQGRPERINRLRIHYYQILDGINLILSNTDSRGWLKNLVFYIREKKLN